MKKILTITALAVLPLLAANAQVAQATIELHEGWNMISTPVNGKNINAKVLTDNGVKGDEILEYNDISRQYANASVIVCGKGYIVYSNAEQNITVGSSYMTDTKPVFYEEIFIPPTAGGSPTIFNDKGTRWQLLGTSYDVSMEELKANGITLAYHYDLASNDYLNTNSHMKAGWGFWAK